MYLRVAAFFLVCLVTSLASRGGKERRADELRAEIADLEAALAAKRAELADLRPAGEPAPPRDRPGGP